TMNFLRHHFHFRRLLVEIVVDLDVDIVFDLISDRLLLAFIAMNHVVEDEDHHGYLHDCGDGLDVLHGNCSWSRE
ncbi:unnamed protein product, partial [Rotaria magnacalcarata]